MIGSVALLIAILCLCGVVVSLVALQSIRAEQERKLAEEVRARLASHGLWAGAWLVGIGADRAERVAEQASGRASPEEILDTWRRAGPRVISHVAGPEVLSESEACGWLEQASEDLTRTRVPDQAGVPRERVFALVYASRTVPPVTTRAPADLAAFLMRPGLLAAAFVACPSAGGRGRVSWNVAALAAAVLFVLGMSAIVIAFVFPDEPPKPPAGAAATNSAVATATLPTASATAEIPTALPTAPPQGATTAASSAKPAQNKPKGK